MFQFIRAHFDDFKEILVRGICNIQLNIWEKKSTRKSENKEFDEKLIDSETVADSRKQKKNMARIGPYDSVTEWEWIMKKLQYGDCWKCSKPKFDEDDSSKSQNDSSFFQTSHMNFIQNSYASDISEVIKKLWYIKKNKAREENRRISSL